MRVIAGTAKRLQLKTVEGMDTRPTTDRIKETLFNMISEYLADSTFLDLFSGSGAIGIEALSRGAASAVFVENNFCALFAFGIGNRSEDCIYLKSNSSTFYNHKIRCLIGKYTS